jgi:hypothetical protein
MLQGIGVPELLVIALTAVLLFGGVGLTSAGRRLGAGLRYAHHGSPMFNRLVMFVLGAVELQALVWFESTTIRPPSLEVLLRGGIVWLALFELVHRTRAHFRIRTLWIYAVCTWVVSGPFYLATLLTTLRIQGQIPRSYQDYYSDPAHWLPSFSRFPADLIDLATACLFVFTSYVVLFRSLPRWQTSHRGGWWSGAKGASMVPSNSQTTRLLCASAILSGAKFRDELSNYLENESHGASPELGVDMGLVAQVCRFAKNREKRFQNYLLLALVAGAVILLVLPVAGIALFVLAAAAIYFTKTFRERTTLIDEFRRDQFSGSRAGKAYRAEMESSAISALPQEDQNLIVYTGFNPFVGAGTELGGWSFTVDLSKPREEYGNLCAPVSFGNSELYDAIEAALSNAGLDGLASHDFYFVSGREIREDKEILPDIYGRPAQRLDPRRALEYQTASDSRIRHYKWIRIHDWGQELVMSYFLRCSLRGRTLFVEINRFLLTPLRAEYRAIDALPPLNTSRTIGMFIAAVFIGPIYAAFTPFLLLDRMNKGLAEIFGGKEKKRRQAIRENPLFDYGAGQGFRSALRSNQFEHYFQKADGDFYTKVMERVILSTIISFLEEHNIDTQDLRERQTMILNSGIIVQGGDVKAESLAVGAGAQAFKSQPAPGKETTKRAHA